MGNCACALIRELLNEVLPSDSPCSGKVDVIFSEYLLRAHHSYRVRVCADQNNPGIIEVIKEIEPSGGEE